MTLNASFKWDIDPIKAVEGLSRGLRNKGMRIAVNKASVPGKQAMVAKVPVASGTLKKAMRIKVKDYKNKSIWTSIIGPSSSVKRNVKVGKKRKGVKQKRIVRRPSKYYPLIQFGTKFIHAQHITEAAFAVVRNQFPAIVNASLREQIPALLAQGK